MPIDRDLASIGALIGDRARSAMIGALLEGPALTARELAMIAGITPQTACFHLTKLEAAGLIRAEASGRLRFYKLAQPRIGAAIRALMRIAPPSRRKRSQSLGASDLRFARSCYGHLAGRLGVALTAAMVERGVLRRREATFEPGARARRFFAGLDIDIGALGRSRRALVRPCLDWTEREPHLAGSLGEAVLAALIERGWLIRRERGRGLRPTRAGETGLRRLIGLEVARLRLEAGAAGSGLSA